MNASSLDTTSAQGRWSYLWLLLGTGLLLFSNGHWFIPLATWLAPVFLIRFTRTQPARKGLGLVLVASVLGNLFFWQGIIPGGAYLPLASGIGVIFWLPYLADRLLTDRLRNFAATLAFPLLQVSLEYINTAVSPFGSWGALAYTQQSFLPLLQLLSITGMWGVSFLIAWLAPVVNYAWDQDFALQRLRTAALTYGGILALVLVYGSVRMTFFPPQSATLRVASLIQTTDYLSFLRMDGLLASQDRFPELGERLLQQSRQQAQAGADVIVWQEGAAPVLKKDEAGFIEKARALAQEEKVYLLLGLVTLPEGFPKVKADNQAIWITPDGDVKWHYLKGRPVPGESVVAGDGIIPLDQTAFGAISSVVCFDMDHPVYIGQAGRSGADIMLVPSWDWPDIVPSHTYMASLRGIENGFSIVRVTGDGLSAAFDYQGRTLAAADFATTKQAMISYVPTHGVRTIYAAVGDLFAWLSIAGFVILVGLALVRPRVG
jgi:apolipoprotein N-acyltransferase